MDWNCKPEVRSDDVKFMEDTNRDEIGSLHSLVFGINFTERTSGTGSCFSKYGRLYVNAVSHRHNADN